MKSVYEDLIVTGVDAADAEDAIRQVGQYLFKAGFVKDTYIDAVAQREKEYATGLQLKDMVQIKGLPGAPGCVAGTAVVFAGRTLSLERRSVADPQAEIDAMEAARKRYEKTLADLAADSAGSGAAEQAAIFDAYREILQDDVFFGAVSERIAGESVCASFAIERSRAETEALFSGMRGLLVYFTRDRKKPTELQLAAAKEELDAFMAERIGR